MDRTKKLLLFLFVIIIATAAFYFFYYQKTPYYSLLTIQQAVKNHDVITFEKHVDLDKVLGSFFDDVVENQAEGMSLEEKQMVSSLSRLFKGAFVQTAKEKIINDLSTEKKPSNPTDQESDQTVKTQANKKSIFKNLVDKLQPNKMDFKGAGNTKTEGDTAFIDVTLFDTKLEKDFTFTAQMERQQDRTWKLVGMLNIQNYLRELLNDKISAKR